MKKNNKLNSVKRIAVISIFLSLYYFNAYAAKIYPSAGSTAAAFLKIPAGAGPSGNAGAVSSYIDDGYASYYNPAGLAFLKGKSFSLTHNDYFTDLSQIYAVYSLKNEQSSFLSKISPYKNGGWAFSLNYFYVPGNLEKRSGLYENDPLYPLSPVEGKFSARDAALSVHYGFSLSERTSLGYGLKFINQKIDSQSASSFAGDFGLIRKMEIGSKNISAALAVQNLGPKIKFDSKGYDLPLSFKAAASWELEDKKTVLSSELLKYIDNYPYLIAGVSRKVSEKFFLRAGYKYRINGNELGAWSGAAAGIGFINGKFSFDYALNPYGDLGYAHKFSISYFFSSPVKTPDLKKSKFSARESLEYPLKYKPLKISARGSYYEMSGEYEQGIIKSVIFKAYHRASPYDKLFLYKGKSEDNKNDYYYIASGGQKGEFKVEFRLSKSLYKSVPKIIYAGKEKQSEINSSVCQDDENNFCLAASLNFEDAFYFSEP